MIKTPTCYIMVGAPYSGKTFFIEHNAILRSLPVVSSDNEVHRLCKEHGTTYNDSFAKYIGKATKIYKMKMRVLMRQKKDFIIDRTNLTKKARKPLIEALRREGYRVECVWFKPAETQAQMDELERRIAFRHDQSVPFGILMKMYQSFEIPTKDEGFDKIWSPVEFGY